LTVSTGVCVRILKGQKDSVTDVVLLLDERICSISRDGSAKIWNTETVVCDINILVGSDLSICEVVLLHDGRLVVPSNNKCMCIIK
jgi:WD40 repeat protein